MDRPTTATGAVAALVATADLHGFGRFALDTDDPVTALTRRFPDDTMVRGVPLASRVAEARRLHMAAAPHLRDELPPVLVPLPDLALVGDRMLGDPVPELRDVEGWDQYPYPVGTPLVARRARDRQRMRAVVLAGPEAPPHPAGTRALALSVLTARSTAAALTAWASGAGSAAASRLARTEATAYRSYANDAEAAIGPSCAWVDDLDTHHTGRTQPTVPAVIRGTAHLGVT